MAPSKKLVLGKWHHPNPIAKGMSMGMTGSPGVEEGTIIPQGNPLREFMQV
jgi:hypothetical protein